jgi:hypothetical protein
MLTFYAWVSHCVNVLPVIVEHASLEAATYHIKTHVFPPVPSLGIIRAVNNWSRKAIPRIDRGRVSHTPGL